MRRSLNRAGFILSAAMLLGGASAVAVGPSALAAPHSATTTLTPASASAASSAGQLHAVAAVSAENVWAVGCSGHCNGPDSLVLHWNGKKWSVGNACIGCSAPGMTAETFTIRWNGKRWSRAGSAGPSTGYNVLFGVKTLGPDNAWAMGDTNGSSGIDALIVHWNGKDWSQAASANPGSSFNDVRAVSAVSARDIWAVGDQSDGGFPYDTLTEQRVGGAWTAVASPNGTTTDINMLAGVAAISSKDVVAVGWVQTAAGYRVLILKWNGTRWAKA